MAYDDNVDENKARLRCVPLKITVTMEWWPTDVSRTLSSRNVSELERADKRPLAVPTSLTADDYSIGYTMRTMDHRKAVHTNPVDNTTINVTQHIADLETIARSKYPVQLCFGKNVEGLFRVEAPSLTILEWAANGKPSVVDISLTLKRASDATVRVGLIKRVKGRAKNMAKKKR